MSDPYWIKAYPCDEYRLLVVDDAVVAEVMPEYGTDAAGETTGEIVGWSYIHMKDTEYPVFGTRDDAMEAARKRWDEHKDDPEEAGDVEAVF